MLRTFQLLAQPGALHRLAGERRQRHAHQLEAAEDAAVAVKAAAAPAETPRLDDAAPDTSGAGEGDRAQDEDEVPWEAVA